MNKDNGLHELKGVVTEEERKMRKKILRVIKTADCSDWAIERTCASIAAVCAVQTGIPRKEFLGAMKVMYDEIIKLTGEETV